MAWLRMVRVYVTQLFAKQRTDHGIVKPLKLKSFSCRHFAGRRWRRDHDHHAVSVTGRTRENEVRKALGCQPIRIGDISGIFGPGKGPPGRYIRSIGPGALAAVHPSSRSHAGR
jgi:hypothetical protein